MWAVELNFDRRAEESVRAIWAAIDARGVESLGSVPGTAYRPHVTLAVFDDADQERMVDALAPVVSRYVGMPLTLAALGLFLSPEAVAFVGVTPTARLLDLHRAVHAALRDVATGSWPLYAPGSFHPHCTLATGFRDAAPVVDAVRAEHIPIYGLAREVHVVETSSGRSLVRLG